MNQAGTLYLIEILHQTTTTIGSRHPRRSCILSKFYIKPQHRQGRYYRQKVVSYRNSTSNHNCLADIFRLTMLYLIEILHQTTTNSLEFLLRIRLYLIEILHQTTTYRSMSSLFRPLYLIEILHQTTTEREYDQALKCCILSKFYIKPQHFDFSKRINYVVSYRNSTSNHNSGVGVNATMSLYLIEILHQTTTPPRTRACSL